MTTATLNKLTEWFRQREHQPIDGRTLLYAFEDEDPEEIIAALEQLVRSGKVHLWFSVENPHHRRLHGRFATPSAIPEVISDQLEQEEFETEHAQIVPVYEMV